MHDPMASIFYNLFLFYLRQVVVVNELVEKVFEGAVGVFDIFWHFFPFLGGLVLDVILEAGGRRREAAYFCSADFCWFVSLTRGDIEGELEGGGAGINGEDEKGIGVGHGGIRSVGKYGRCTKVTSVQLLLSSIDLREI